MEDFLAKTNTQKCGDFKETAEVVAKVGLKMFLGINASVTNWNADGTECGVVLENNPLTDFVELPVRRRKLTLRRCKLTLRRCKLTLA